MLSSEGLAGAGGAQEEKQWLPTDPSHSCRADAGLAGGAVRLRVASS